MNENEFTIRKTPFLFLKWLVAIEFFFAILPFLALTVARVRESYDSSALSQTVSYSLLVAIVLTTLQILIIVGSFTAWYFPVYSVDKQRILYRRSNMFEDRELVNTQSITHIDLKQGPLARRFNYGTLVIHSQDMQEQMLVKDVPNPTHQVRLIEDLVEQEQASLPPLEQKPIQELIGGGEHQTVEFKSSLMWDYRRQMANKDLYEPVMKNVVAFMNSTGGVVIIGVDDEGQVLGLDADFQVMGKPNADGFENVFNMAFNKMVGVELRRFISVTFPEIEGKQICVISVRPSSHPAYLVFKGKEIFYIRAGNASQPLSVSQATRYIQDHFRD